MNSYTAEELNSLLKELIIPVIVDEDLNFVTIQPGRTIIRVNEKSFFSIVFLDPALNPLDFLHNVSGRRDVDVLLDMRKFIYEVPLYQVPLYINIYEVLVAWRLKIGK